MKVAIIGAGTFGSYAARLLSNRFPSAKITLFEVGDEKLKTENEIGYASEVTGASYNALSKGRFFGLGGTSNRWGGQILSFEETDFDSPDPWTRDLTRLAGKYQEPMRELLQLPKLPEEPDPPVFPGLRPKTGVWLSYPRRNLYRALRIANISGIKVLTNARVVRLLHDSSHIEGIELLEDGKLRTESFDHYLLTCGAFEANRLLLHSGFRLSGVFTFSDHLSQPAFLIRGSTRLGRADLRFRFRGASMITKRLVGEVGGCSFFAHPVYNINFEFFSHLKKVMYGGDRSRERLTALLVQLPHGLRFAYELLAKRRLFVHENSWILQLDIETPPGWGKGRLSDQVDGQGQPGLELSISRDLEDRLVFRETKEKIQSFLAEENVDFEALTPKGDGSKYEDTYHPYNMAGADCSSADEFFQMSDNLLIANTGILPRAGSINCSAAVFPVLHEWVERGL